MRSIVLSLLLASACTERALDANATAAPADTPDASVCGTSRICTVSATHQQFELDGVCVTPTAGLVITGKPLSLGFCNCLHGCGPGIDGAIELTIENHSPSSHQLELNAVEYSSTTPVQVIFEDDSKQPGLRRQYACPGEPMLWNGRIASGTSERAVIAQHFDAMNPFAGGYRLRVQLRVDGQLVWFELGTITMAYDMSCQ